MTRDESRPAGWMTTAAAAEYAGLAACTIYRAVQNGELSGCKYGRKWLFKADDIDEWIERGRVRAHRPKSGGAR